MLRAEMARAVSGVRQALSASNIQTALEALAAPDGQRPVAPGHILAAFQSYSAAARDFGPTQKQLVEDLDLAELTDPEWWGQFLLRGQDDQGRGAMQERLLAMSGNIRFAVDYLPKILRILEPGSLSRYPAGMADGPEPDHRHGTLTVVLPEDERQVSSPARLIETLESVVRIYQACADLHGLPSNDLAVVSCDSGSDKQFDFTGLEKNLATARNIILSTWEQVVFHRDKPFSTRIQQVTGSLPIVQEISQLEQAGSLPREKAEILRRRVVEGVTKFVEAGAIIPEIEDRTQFDPRELLRPRASLLLDGPGQPPEGASDSDRSDGRGSAQDAAGATGGPAGGPQPAGSSASPSRHARSGFDDLAQEERDALQRLLRKHRDGMAESA